MFGGNQRNIGFPVFLEENQYHYDSNASTQLQLFGNILASCNADPSNCAGTNNISSLNRPSKRGRETGDIAMQNKLQISLSNFYHDEADRSANVLNPNAVSTGLRLSYDNDESNSSVTSASGSLTSLPVIMSFGDNLRSELERQKEELDNYIRVQEEHFAKGVKEMTQRHTASVLSAIEKGVGWKLREKELVIESMNRKNKELAEQIKQVGAEVHAWQYKAQYNESVVNTLKNSLRQAMAAKGAAAVEQVKEGCGDSEVDDAASTYDPHALLAAAGRTSVLTMPCRGCGCREVSMLLLPCRHLCLCKECDGFVDTCPVCMSFKTGSAEVYMS